MNRVMCMNVLRVLNYFDGVLFVGVPNWKHGINIVRGRDRDGYVDDANDAKHGDGVE